MTQNATTATVVLLDRPGRYGKQLTNHMRRRFGGEWSTETERGHIDLGEGHVTLIAASGELRIDMDAPAELLDQLEEAVGRHLVLFVGSPTLTVTWTRGDGSTGTTQDQKTLEAAQAERARRTSDHA